MENSSNSSGSPSLFEPTGSSLTQVDGTIDITSSDMGGRRKRLPGDVCAVFVHAGAGYHSIQNERVHLAACEDAAKSAMTFLNNGGSAVDAVEIAIKVLEDKEITNAGFGSNLAMDGTVECDATIVDHYGRSGAVGAVGCIRNPIHLARVVLEHSSKPLSLRRVPPNLLVGKGAIDFAAEVSVPVVHPDLLVSPAAGERYARWKTDLDKVEPINEDSDMEVDEFPIAASPEPRSEKAESLDQKNLEFVPCWNEAQAYSPRITPSDALSLTGKSGTDRHLGPSNDPGHDGHGSIRSPHTNDDESYLEDNIPWLDIDERRALRKSTLAKESKHDSSEEVNHPRILTPKAPPPTPAEGETQTAAAAPGAHADSMQQMANAVSRPDDITDTVGAIAIDCLGNIAAGSSSGGIGMKHRGRVGPAALVGIGTAVVPIEPSDGTKLCVATVTSGTGEHMATTMAAGSCASRLYSTTCRGSDGSIESAEDDDQAIRSFVEKDFMGHPSVVHSHSAGAIGILGVKKTTAGVHLYFAHNTDSFAVGSMAGDDREPRSVMSRNPKGHNNVVTGGRSVRHRRWPSAHKSTWPTNPDEALDPDGDPHHVSKRQKTKRVSKDKSNKHPKSKSAAPAPNGAEIQVGQGSKQAVSAS